MKFSHRLNNEEITDYLALTDAIDAMTARANSVLTVLQCSIYEDGSTNFSEGILFNALEAVSCEILDIRDTVHSFHDAERAKKNPN